MTPESPHVLFTGGGTLGPVTPLMAVADAWKAQNARLRVSWIGTPHGPERAVIEARHETFYELAAPKFSRHAWWQWPLIVPLFAVSCVRAYLLLSEMEPDVMVSAGAYVSVPVAFAARLLRIPVWIHQLDVEPGMANKLMAPVATRISVTFTESEDAFPKKKTSAIGGMLREGMVEGDKGAFLEKYGLDANRKTVLVLGGGTGARELNEAFAAIGRDLLRQVNVVHLTGAGKMLSSLQGMGEGYVAAEFMGEELKDAYAAADLVVARAGMGTMFEIAGLKKPAILVPLAGSHQEANARLMAERGGAVVLSRMTPQILKQEIVKLLGDEARLQELGEAAFHAVSLRGTQRMVEGLKGLVG